MKLRSMMALASGAMLMATFPLAYADSTVTAKLHFENMLPFTGIVYAPDATDTTLQRGILDQHDKQFSAPIAVVSPNAELKIKNSDPFEHNVYADDRKQTGIAFDLGRIEPTEEYKLPIRWKEDSLLRLGCKIHPKMRAYVANIRSHYYGVVEFMPAKYDYEVTLSHVPDRLEEIRVLLPDLAPLSVSVKAGQSKSMAIKVNGHDVGTIEVSRSN